MCVEKNGYLSCVGAKEISFSFFSEKKEKNVFLFLSRFNMFANNVKYKTN